MRHGIIGMGRVGHVIASLLTESGEQVTGLSSAHSGSRETSPCLLHDSLEMLMATEPKMLWVTVPDARIRIALEELQRGWDTRDLHIIHCSGVTRCDELLAELKPVKGIAGAHPLQAFSGGKHDLQLARVAQWYVGGTESTATLVSDILQRAGIDFRPIEDEDRERYHAAAVLISNGLVALASICERLMPDGRIDSLLPLAQGTLSNLSCRSPQESMTGPVQRGDASTLSRHLESLRAHPQAHVLYKELSRALIDLRPAPAEEETARERSIRSSLRQALESSTP